MQELEHQVQEQSENQSVVEEDTGKLKARLAEVQVLWNTLLIRHSSLVSIAALWKIEAQDTMLNNESRSD